MVSLRPLEFLRWCSRGIFHSDSLLSTTTALLFGTTAQSAALLSTLLDACHSAGNYGVCVNAAVGGGGAGLAIPRDATSEEALKRVSQRLSSAFRGELKKTGDAGGGDGEVGYSLVRVYHISLWWNRLRELNANVSFMGWP